MESNLVCEFVSETGASSVDAYNCLQAKGWDLKLAIHDYLLSKDGILNNERTLSTRCRSAEESNSNYKKLARGISRATDNINLINKARTELGLDFHENGVCNINQYFIETPVFTFTLPDLSIFPDDFREFLEKDLIETSSLVSLEQAGRLNWWADNGICQRLWPLATTGDGNCLLHAASLGMWGFHDRLLTLRRALHDFLSSSNYKEALWRRWRWQLTRLNAEAGLVYTEEEWRKEWESIVSMASSTPRNSSRRRSAVIDKPTTNKEVSENATYESLEEIHVLALSHVLKRPIIVIADTVLKDVHGEALAPILFGGIYLPLEIAPSECHKSPLVLTFDAAHFSALVVMEKETFADKAPHPPAVIPLTDSQHKMLPVQFSVDPGEDFPWESDENLMQFAEKLSLGTKEIHYLLREYLDVVYVPLTPSPSSDEVDFELDLDTPCDEEDIEKRFIEANEYDLDDNTPEITESSLFSSNKSKAAKQMKSVAKQFGSIGKSMSKKLKKNLGTITKITRNNSQKKDRAMQSRPEDLAKTQEYIFGARLHTEARHEYQEEMIKNYLTTARDRFEREKNVRHKFSEEDVNFDDERLQEQAKIEGPKNCITQGCNMYGTVLTSYLCTNCYNKQRQEELNTNINSPSLPRAFIGLPKKSMNTSKVDTPGYGTGRSTFYFEASPKAYENAKSFSMTTGKSLKPPDETIYLSNSTFYNDRPSQTGFYPKQWKNNGQNGSNRHTMQYPIRSDDHSKTCQEEITNQIDGLGSLTLPSEFSSRSNHLRSSADRLKKQPAAGDPGFKLADDGTKGTVLRSAGYSVSSNDDPRQRVQSYDLSGDSFQSSEDAPYHSNFRELFEKNPFDVQRIVVSSVASAAPDETVSDGESTTWRTHDRNSNSNNNFVTTIPVRESSQTNLEQLVRETTEYYNRNSKCKEESDERLVVRHIPIEYADGDVAKADEVDLPSNNRHEQDKFVDRKLCLNVTCKFFGSPELDNYCSQCHRGRYENLRLDSGTKK